MLITIDTPETDVHDALVDILLQVKEETFRIDLACYIDRVLELIDNLQV